MTQRARAISFLRATAGQHTILYIAEKGPKHTQLLVLLLTKTFTISFV